MMGLKIFTMVEPLDGFKFDFMAPLSPRFQVGGAWVFSNTKTNRFELNTALSSLPSGNNPMMAQDEMSFISTRSDSSGKLELSGSWNLGHGFSIKPEGFFLDNDMQKYQLQVELMKEFNDSHISYKCGGGVHTFSMMQSISSKLMAGFEMFYNVTYT